MSDHEETVMDLDASDEPTLNGKIRVRLAQWHWDREAGDAHCKAYDYADRLVAELAAVGLHVVEGPPRPAPEWCSGNLSMQSNLEAMWGNFIAGRNTAVLPHVSTEALEETFGRLPAVADLVGYYKEWAEAQKP